MKTGYFYRLNGDGEKAKNEIAEALYPGLRGNDLSVAIQDDVDHEGKFIVTTYLKTDGVLKAVDEQDNVATGEELAANDYVKFIKTGDLTATASTALTGGTNGSEVTTANYQDYIELIEPYYFNCLGYAGTDSAIQSLLINFVKRCREDSGAKFQVILYGKEKANYEGVISIKNNVTDAGEEPGSLVYWLTGAEASCAINASCTNKIYDGEYTVNTAYKQYELEQAIADGLLMFHNVTDAVSGNVEGDTRVLKDINTFTEFTKDKNEDFSFNQVIRVLDNAAIDWRGCLTGRISAKCRMTTRAGWPFGMTAWRSLKITRKYAPFRTSWLTICLFRRRVIPKILSYGPLKSSRRSAWKNCTVRFT